MIFERSLPHQPRAEQITRREFNKKCAKSIFVVGTIYLATACGAELKGSVSIPYPPQETISPPNYPDLEVRNYLQYPIDCDALELYLESAKRVAIGTVYYCPILGELKNQNIVGTTPAPGRKQLSFIPLNALQYIDPNLRNGMDSIGVRAATLRDIPDDLSTGRSSGVVYTNEPPTIDDQRNALTEVVHAIAWGRIIENGVLGKPDVRANEAIANGYSWAWQNKQVGMTYDQYRERYPQGRYAPEIGVTFIVPSERQWQGLPTIPLFSVKAL